jgi:diguanylate cyclase (GGDEF)-like protein/PAS domain S-box-containing protein
MRHYADSSDPGPEAAYAWVLERPLRLDSVIVQIQQAVRANRVFLSRYHQVIEDLYRSRTIFDSVQNGISLADAALPDMPLVYVNPAFERMTGYTAAEVYGSNCRFLQGAETDQPAIAEIQAAMHERRPVQVLMRNYRKDGTPFWNELQLSPIRGLDGQVTHFVGIQNDVTERVEATQRLEQLAYYDALTKLANRTLLAEQLKQALARAKRSRTKLAVVLFKLDNLMQINCDFGRHAGDSVLRVMAMRLKQTARDHETAARLEPLSGSGGNEFVVVLEELVDEAQHLEATRRLSAALREPIDFEGTRLFPGFRVGAALFPRHGYQPDKLLDVARDQVEEPHLDASTAAALHS